MKISKVILSVILSYSISSVAIADGGKRVPPLNLDNQKNDSVFVGGKRVPPTVNFVGGKRVPPFI